MALKTNNSEVENVLYNGNQVSEVQLNGVTVWELDKGGANLSGIPNLIASITADFNQPAYAVYEIKPDGTHFAIANGFSAILINPNWLPEEDDSSDYEVMFTKVTSTGPAAVNGTFDQWLSLTIDRQLVSLSATGKNSSSNLRLGITVRKKDLSVSAYKETTLRTLWSD